MFFWEIKENNQHLKHIWARDSFFRENEELIGPVTDKSLAEKVASLGKDTIESISLHNSSMEIDSLHEVGNNSIPLLASLPKLECADLSKSRVTEQGIIYLLEKSSSVRCIGAPITLTESVAQAIVAHGHIGTLHVHSATDEGLRILSQHHHPIKLGFINLNNEQIRLLFRSRFVIQVLTNDETPEELRTHCRNNEARFERLAQQWGRVAFNMSFIRANKERYRPYMYSGLPLAGEVMKYLRGPAQRGQKRKAADG